jgi:hypothetical protein
VSGALLALPFGLGVGLLGLVGGGGSILAVPVLVYVLGQPVKAATTESLLIVGTAALVGAAAYARSGRVQIRTGPSPSARRARPERSPAPRSTGSSAIGRCCSPSRCCCSPPPRRSCAGPTPARRAAVFRSCASRRPVSRRAC